MKFTLGRKKFKFPFSALHIQNTKQQEFLICQVWRFMGFAAMFLYPAQETIIDNVTS